MKNKLPDLLAWFRLLSSPVLLFLILDDGSDTGLMLYPAILAFIAAWSDYCLLYTSPSPRDLSTSRMPSSA